VEKWEEKMRINLKWRGEQGVSGRMERSDSTGIKLNVTI